MSHRPFSVCLSVLLITAPVWAQGSGPSSSNPGRDDAARKKLEDKAAALLDQVIADAGALKVPDNRIRVWVAAADLLWEGDPKRARALFKEATDDLVSFIGGLDVNGPSSNGAANQAAAQLRSEMLSIAAHRDPELALDFIHVTHMPNPQQSGLNQQLDYDSTLELDLASQIAGSDPKRAFQIAERDLAKGGSSEVLGVLSALSQKDTDDAATLAADIATGLQSSDFTADQNVLNVGLGLLDTSMRPVNPGFGQGQADAKPLLTNQTIESLVGRIVDSLSSAFSNTGQPGSQWQARNILNRLMGLVPALGQINPSLAASLTDKAAAIGQSPEPQAAAWSTAQALAQTGTVDELIAAGSRAPADTQTVYYQQAYWKAASEGDYDRARQIVNDHIPDPNGRIQMLANLDRQAAISAASNGKIDQALQIISSIQSKDQQAAMIMQLAASLGEKDPKVSLDLADKARLLLTPIAQNYAQIYVQIQIAHIYDSFDPGRGLNIGMALASRFNTLIAAQAVLNGFDVLNAFEGDELVLRQGNQMTNSFQQFSDELGNLAMKDFAAAASVTASLERPETRMFTRLAIVKVVMSRLKESNSSAIPQPAEPIDSLNVINH